MSSEEECGPVTALVLGGYGAVGAGIVEGLRLDGHVALAVGRKPGRADVVLDLTNHEAYRRALYDVDMVVNASGLEDPALAEMATSAGAAFVDITATREYVEVLEGIDPPAPLLLSVGLTPGLTNLLAVAAFDSSPGPVDIALMLGAGERHGVAATHWSLGLLGGRFPDPGSSGSIRNYTHPSSFDLPGYGGRRLFRADFSDQHTLSRDLGVPVRTFLGLDSRIATAALAALTWVPGASRLPAGLHLPGSDRWLSLARAEGGSLWWAEGRGQSRATAAMTTLAVRLLSDLRPGVHHLHQVMNLDDVPSGTGIRISTSERDGGHA